MTKQIVWVVMQGEKGEGGSVKGIFTHRTQARIMKRDLCRDRWFFPECDWVKIYKMKVHIDWAEVDNGKEV